MLWCCVDFVVPLNSIWSDSSTCERVGLSVWWTNWSHNCTYTQLNAACACGPSYCHFLIVFAFITIYSENDLYFKLTVLVSEGVLHNRQFWPEAPRAAKLWVLSPQITLMWNNLVFCLWCFSAPCAVCLLPYHLSYPELTPNCIGFCQAHYVILYVSFVLMLLPSGLCSAGCTYLASLWLFSCLCSLAVFWIPKCSAFRLEGEWLLSSWSRFPTAHIWAAAQFWGPCCWDITGMWFLWHKNTHTLMCSSWWKSIWKTNEANCCHIKSHGEIIIFSLHYPSMTMQPSVTCIVNKGSKSQGP